MDRQQAYIMQVSLACLLMVYQAEINPLILPQPVAGKGLEKRRGGTCDARRW
jgi:hypothetical protein